MQKATNLFFRFLDILLGLILATMAIMVFVNVIMRYTMNSGFQMSEELSRFGFVWLTFIGAVVAHHHQQHMGMETLVAQFGRKGRMVLMGLSNLLIMGCSAVLLVGTWKQMPINATLFAPVSGVSMAWVYGIGLFAAIGLILITFERLVRLLTGRITDQELSEFGGDLQSIEDVSEGKS